jgi:hypothetical protein
MSQMVLTVTLAALLGLAGARRFGLFTIALASFGLAAVVGLLADGSLLARLAAAAATLVSFQVAALAGLLYEALRPERVPVPTQARSRRV